MDEYNHLWNVEFKQLIRFITVAEQGTLAQAAEILKGATQKCRIDQI